MRLSDKAAFLLPLFFVLLFAAGGAMCQTSTYWETFHLNNQRIGYGADVHLLDAALTNTTNDGSRMQLMWTFPMPDAIVAGQPSAHRVDIDYSVVNIRPCFTLTGTDWTAGPPVPPDAANDRGDSYGGEFFWADASGTEDLRAEWRFPDSNVVNLEPTEYLSEGDYEVYVFFPSTPTGDGAGAKRRNTTAAEYHVVSRRLGANVDEVFSVDQRVGGDWVRLGSGGFHFVPGEQNGVYLTNRAGDYSRIPASNPIVIADAVRFVPAMNRSIYASPVTAEFDPDMDVLPNYRRDWGAIPAVYFGTVDTPIQWEAVVKNGNVTRGLVAAGMDLLTPNPVIDILQVTQGSTRYIEDVDWRQSGDYVDWLGSGNEPAIGSTYAVRWTYRQYNDYGTIYCVNSDVVQQDGEWYAGKAIWQYPRPVDPVSGIRVDPLEGPIEGGIYSAAAVATIGGEPRVFVAAADRQVYALNAATGDLIWKGPGRTVSETPDDPSKWDTITHCFMAFGGAYLRTEAKNGGTDFVEWDGPDSNALFANPGEGRAYAIYAWLPVDSDNPADVNSLRVRDAHYEITYDGGATETIRVDQEGAHGAAGWVKIGKSYWNPSAVRLTNDTQRDSGVPEYVVADAVMFVPEYLSSFSYSNPAVVAGSTVYVGNLNGRVYALDANGNGNRTTRERWVYPTVRNQNNLAPGNGELAPWGAIAGSVAIDGDRMYVPSTNGRVYRLTSIASDAPNGPVYNPDTGVFPDLAEPAEGEFSSTPVVDGNRDIYVASTDGQLFKLTAADSDTPLAGAWVFPGDDGDPDTSDIVGAFRYSTPAIRPGPDGREAIFAGCSDGRVYAVHTNDGSPHWDWRDPNAVPPAPFDPSNTAQLLSAPVLSSVAVDNNTAVGSDGLPTITVFAAAMDGYLWWMYADTGEWPEWRGRHIGDAIFSSPSLTNFMDAYSYLHIGSDNGRLYAFSATVNGGLGWIGEDEGIPEPDDGEEVRYANPVDDIQAQVVGAEVYEGIRSNPTGLPADASADPPVLENSLLTNATYGVTTHAASVGHGIGTSLRAGTGNEVIYEWGERINVVVWNLNPPTDIANVTIKLFSSSRGGDAANPGTGGNESGSFSTQATKRASDVIQYNNNADPAEPRGYTTHQFEIPRSWMRQGNNRPPGPGSAWVINVTMTLNQQAPDGVRAAQTVVPNAPPVMETAQGQSRGQARYREQFISVNNPLAIGAPQLAGRDPRDANGNGKRLGWTTNRGGRTSARVNGDSGFRSDRPVVGFGTVNHNINSVPFELQVMDRSCMGLDGQTLNSFRIEPADLYWRGGAGRVFNTLRWDWPPTEERGNFLELFSGMESAYVGSQIDYPDIRKRYLSFHKISDGANPVAQRATLLEATGIITAPDARQPHPDPVEAYVNVPQFQPANTYWADAQNTSDGSVSGYGSRMTAYLDVNGNGNFDSGNFLMGRPTTFVEPYRPFRVNIAVPPDYRIRVEESVIDLGKAPHGLGVAFAADPDSDLSPFGSWSPFGSSMPVEIPSPDWYRPFTAENVGNVNVYNVRVNAYPMFSDQSSIPILPSVSWGGVDLRLIRSSLDANYDTTLCGKSVMPATGEGHTISKALVGDTEPTVLSVPDKRGYDRGFASLLPDCTEPERPTIGVVVPLTQPVGTYAQRVPILMDPLPGQTITDPPYFFLKVTVRENRLTDGTAPGPLPQIETDGRVDGALPQIDVPALSLDTFAKPPSGDVQPAAFIDPVNHNAYMFWASNRTPAPAPASPPARPSPNSPWHLFEAILQRGSTEPYDWTPGVTEPRAHWWGIQGSISNWPVLNTEPSVPGTILPDTVKHLSPSIAQDQATCEKCRECADKTCPACTDCETWLFWQGQVYKDPGGGPMNQENRVFYAKVENGAIQNPQPLTEDFSMVKYGPRAAVYRDYTDAKYRWMWLFYYGGDAGRWGIFYNAHYQLASDDERTWTADTKLLVPSSLSSVYEPVVMRRRVLGADYLDVTYTGVSKEGQNSDIFMSRYRVDYGYSSASPSAANLDLGSLRLTPMPFPRARNEVMNRDEARGVYTARSIWWLSPSSQRPPTVRVQIPGLAGGAPWDVTSDVTPVMDKATGTYIYNYEDSTVEWKHLRWLNLRRMIIDPGAGTVRFGRPVPPKTRVKVSYTPRALRLSANTRYDTDNAANWATDEPGDPVVGGSGTMRTQRWGGNADSDTSSFTFIDRSDNTPNTANCSIGNWPEPGNNSVIASGPPVDRLWLLWRKPASGVRATTIFYKTYRIGVHLSERMRVNVKWLDANQTVRGPGQTLDSTLNKVKIQEETGSNTNSYTDYAVPFEVDWERSRIYFTSDVERYPELKDINQPPPRIRVVYDAIAPDGTVQSGREETFDTVTWQPELEETALLGSAAEAMVNEGQVCAFAEPCQVASPDPDIGLPLGNTQSRIWVFWTSTRTGLTDLFYETLSPNFRLATNY